MNGIPARKMDEKAKGGQRDGRRVGVHGMHQGGTADGLFRICWRNSNHTLMVKY